MTNSLFNEDIFQNLPRGHPDNFDSLYDDRPSERKYNRSVSVHLDTDTYSAVQDLLANKDLPFQSSLAAFMRHAVAVTVVALQEYLQSDTRTLWSALQASQRRLSAERYAVTAEEQVKAASELLEAWSASQDWVSVSKDMEFAQQMVDDLPHPAWRRRMARSWLQNPAVIRLLLGWQDTLAIDEPELWQQVRAVFEHMRTVAGSD